jgi:DNA/RNA non-specific endonuclease
MHELAGADPAMRVAHLDNTLPALWQADYLGMPGSTENLVTVTQDDASGTTAFCRYLFDHASDVSHVGPADSIAEDRVAAVWGTSRQVEARTRDRARIRGFPKGPRPAQDDRGHFFAHTMGGGLDINLFPQSSRVNRGGLWRKMENYCARNPGTFCFVRPIYADTSWRPAQIEYGIVKAESGTPPELWRHLFDN